MTVDELRKNIESLPPADYDKMGYYDRWVISLTQTMIQRGVITTDELAKKMSEVGKRNKWGCPYFSVGDSVRVRKAAPLGHVRTPFYIRGHAGVVERYCGAFPNPEELAQQRDGLPAQPLVPRALPAEGRVAGLPRQRRRRDRDRDLPALDRGMKDSGRYRPIPTSS